MTRSFAELLKKHNVVNLNYFFPPPLDEPPFAASFSTASMSLFFARSVRFSSLLSCAALPEELSCWRLLTGALTPTVACCPDSDFFDVELLGIFEAELSGSAGGEKLEGKSVAAHIITHIVFWREDLIFSR